MMSPPVRMPSPSRPHLAAVHAASCRARQRPRHRRRVRLAAPPRVAPTKAVAAAKATRRVSDVVTANRFRHRHVAKAGRRKTGAARPASAATMARMAAAMPDTVAAVTLVRVSMHREDERLLAVVAVHRAVNLQHRRVVARVAPVAPAARGMAAAAPVPLPAVAGVNAATSTIVAPAVVDHERGVMAAVSLAIPAAGGARLPRGKVATVGATATAFPANREASRRAVQAPPAGAVQPVAARQPSRAHAAGSADRRSLARPDQCQRRPDSNRDLLSRSYLGNEASANCSCSTGVSDTEMQIASVGRSSASN